MSEPAYTEFEFDLPDALLSNLVRILDKLEPAKLTPDNVKAIPDEQGIYQLFLDDAPVYVGKTDAQAGLNTRLSRHCRKILHRRSLDPERVSFRAVRIFVFTAVDMETDLIRHYGGVKGLAWNGSGFGSNDPGRKRDETRNKAGNFDYEYPADIDRTLEGDLAAGSAAEVWDALNKRVPYTLRAQDKMRHADLKGSPVPELKAPFTARQAVRHVVKHLPAGWQATKLLGYVILYKERKDDYPQSEVIARSV